MLLCSPLAKGLMQRAIMESGPVLLAMNGASLEKGERFGTEVARSLGFSGGGEIDQLRALPAETVVQKINDVGKRVGDPGTVVDGWVLTEGPGRTFAHGSELPVDFMIGNNGREIRRVSCERPRRQHVASQRGLAVAGGSGFLRKLHFDRSRNVFDGQYSGTHGGGG